jgi:hypothetical protein
MEEIYSFDSLYQLVHKHNLKISRQDLQIDFGVSHMGLDSKHSTLVQIERHFRAE